MTVILKDGTTIVAEYQEVDVGPVYITETPVDTTILSEDNLSDVTIDGEKKGMMVLDFISPDGMQLGLRFPTSTEVELHSLTEQITAQQEAIKVLERKVYGDITFTFNMIAGASKPTNIYQATTEPLTQDVTEPELIFDFGTSKADSYQFTFPYADCPKEFYITKANGNYSLYNNDSYIKVRMVEWQTEYVFNGVDCKNNRG